MLLLTASACDRQAATAPGVSVLQPYRINLERDAITVADGLLQLTARVIDSLYRPLPGARIVFRVLFAPADSMVAYSDSSGIGTVFWRVPQRAGAYPISIQAGRAALTGSAQVLPGPIVRVELKADSIRFTRMGQSVKRSMQSFDRFDNLRSSDLGGFTLDITGPFSAAARNDSLTIVSSRYAIGAGELVVRGSLSGSVLTRIALNLDPVPVAVTVTGELDSLAGIGVHESTLVQVTVRDSGNVIIPTPNLAAIGVQFTSSAPAVASVSASGVVTGLKPGSSIITARYGSSSYSATLPVVQSYDYGVSKTIYANYAYDGYTQYSVPVTDDAGNSLLITSYPPHHSNGEAIISWHHPDGVTRWTRTIAYPGYAMFKNGSEVYVADPAHIVALDAAGAAQWTQPVGGMPVLFQNGVLVLRDSNVSAVTPDGTLLWSRTYPGTWNPQAAIGAGDRIYLRTISTDGHAVTLGLGLDGGVVWKRTDAALLDADGVRVYTKTNDAITALDRSGQVVWATPMFGGVVAARGPSESLIVQSSSELRAVERSTGRTLWSQPVQRTYTTPIVIGSKVLTFDTYVRTWNAMTGELLGRNATGGKWAGCTSVGLFVSDDYHLVQFDHC